MIACHLCPSGDAQIPDVDVLDHLRVVHPDAYGNGPDLWPDGTAVVIDAALTPDDFGDPS